MFPIFVVELFVGLLLLQFLLHVYDRRVARFLFQTPHQLHLIVGTEAVECIIWPFSESLVQLRNFYAANGATSRLLCLAQQAYLVELAEFAAIAAKNLGLLKELASQPNHSGPISG